jgi:hypothetical protein
MKLPLRLAISCALIVLTAFVAVAAYAAQEKASHMTAPKIKESKANDSSSPSGKVVETMNSGGYTYVCLEKLGKKIWVAVPEMKVVVGKDMAFQPGQEMTDFASKSLGRTFDSIIFSGGPAEGPQSAGGLPASHNSAMLDGAGSKTAASPADKTVKVEKAAGPNAYTVGEIFAKRTALHKKAVVVRGKVVKVSVGIMGMNWIHLQDGTGDQKKSTHNLVATSDEQPIVGDVVTIKGIVYKDKDFGSGYKYNVILEKAKIQP